MIHLDCMTLACHACGETLTVDKTYLTEMRALETLLRRASLDGWYLGERPGAEKDFDFCASCRENEGK